MDGTRWLTPEESQTWRSFLAACQAFFTSVEGQLQRDAGMPMAYYEILARLSEAPGHSLRMSQLAEAAAASKSRASHAVARLEERGWVRRVECPTDRRGQIAQLTEEGYSVLAQAAPAHVEQVRRALFDSLTPDQVKQLREICEAMISAAGPAAEDGSCPPACPGDIDDTEEPAGHASC
jgi:DNA-binding MarR family transcriptional regulator